MTSPPAPDPLLLAYLERNAADCPACGYSLRGLKSSICPECNTVLALSIGATSSSLGPWVLALIPLAGSAGFDAVACTGVLLFGGTRGLTSFSGPSVFFLGHLTLGAICIAGFALVYQARRRWTRPPLPFRWLLAALVWAVIFGTHAASALYFITLLS